MRVTELREVSLAAEQIDAVAGGIGAVTGHPGYEVQEEPLPPIQARFQSFAVGDRSIAVMDSIGEGTAISRFLERRGAGAFSMTFGVADLDATVAHLRAKGARVLMDEPIVLERVRSGSQHFSKIRLNFVAPSRATHGLVVELQELHGAEDVPLANPPSGPDVPAALNEIHCAVQDVDAAAGELSELFGLEVGPEVVQAQPPEEVRFRNLYLDDRPVLALIEPATETSTIGRFLNRRGEGIFSISLRVPDLDAYSARVKAAGIALLFDEPKVAHATRIGSDALASARINWVRPQPASNRVLFEIQEYEVS
ncbi:MAG: VOC family protein [Chloroflexi bacterium]|nr:VOC family protein [Chloroflexota bacterium]